MNEGVRRKWKDSDSSNSDSIALMSAYDYGFSFSVSLGLSTLYDSACDSDAIASENQPLDLKLIIQ